MGKFAAEEELTNLMDLLDEQDEPVYNKISESIQAYGITAIPFLEATRENALDSNVQSRIKKLIHKINIQNLYFELHNWATIDSKDLLKGYFLISKYLFPDLNEDSVMAKVESLKREVWLELKKDMTPFEKAKVISKVFFELKKFSFNTNSAALPDSLCLNALLNSRKGSPLAFSVLYAGIAQRLELPIYGVNMVDSEFLAYVHSENSQTSDFKKDVQFYLNPFAEGVFFSNLQITEYVGKDYPKEIEKYIGACKNPILISQIISQMLLSYIYSDKQEKVEELLILMQALM